MPTIDFSFEQWSDPDGHFDPAAALAPDALAAEFLGVAGAPCGLVVWGRVLILELVRELLGLAEADLCLDGTVCAVLLVDHLML